MIKRFQNFDQCWRQLRDNFDDIGGVISPKDIEYKLTIDDRNAIGYLCTLWDYAYEGGNRC